MSPHTNCFICVLNWCHMYPQSMQRMYPQFICYICVLNWCNKCFLNRFVNCILNSCHFSSIDLLLVSLIDATNVSSMLLVSSINVTNVSTIRFVTCILNHKCFLNRLCYYVTCILNWCHKCLLDKFGFCVLNWCHKCILKMCYVSSIDVTFVTSKNLLCRWPQNWFLSFKYILPSSLF